MNSEDIQDFIKKGICPRCKNRLVHEEGCLECIFCGWAECPES